MRRVYGNELKKIQLEILDVVADFCQEHDISYWIDCGTLLGAIRHKGYIPWDDDIDIGMLRPDYERFMQLFNQYNQRYYFCCVEIDPNAYCAHGKVMDTTTTLYEPDRSGFKGCINVDIFVYDHVPDAETAEKMYDIRDKYRINQGRKFSKQKPKGNLVKRLLCYALRYALALLPKDYYMKKMVKNAKRYANTETEYVGNFTSITRMICKKSVFDSFTTAQFEGKQYQIPAGYHQWLEAFYGDYMQLPPEEKRVSHHSFEAYVHDEQGVEE